MTKVLTQEEVNALFRGIDYNNHRIESCIFCDMLRDSNNFSLIKRFSYGSLFVNYNQYFRGRVFYIFYKHLNCISEIDEEELIEASKELLQIAKITKKIFDCNLINIVSLGNEVSHLHWHIIPRYKSDKTWGKPPWPHERIMVNNNIVKEIKELYLNELN